MTRGRFGLRGESVVDWSDVLDAPTQAVWPIVAAANPGLGVLMGGTALAMHLRHRRSRDLDVFVHDPFDPETVLECLAAEAAVGLDDIAEGTLNCSVNGVRVQFLHARDQIQLDEPVTIQGLAIGSITEWFSQSWKWR